MISVSNIVTVVNAVIANKEDMECDVLIDEVSLTVKVTANGVDHEISTPLDTLIHYSHIDYTELINSILEEVLFITTRP